MRNGFTIDLQVGVKICYKVKRTSFVAIDLAKVVTKSQPSNAFVTSLALRVVVFSSLPLKGSILCSKLVMMLFFLS